MGQPQGEATTQGVAEFARIQNERQRLNSGEFSYNLRSEPAEASRCRRLFHGRRMAAECQASREPRRRCDRYSPCNRSPGVAGFARIQHERQRLNSGEFSSKIRSEPAKANWPSQESRETPAADHLNRSQELGQQCEVLAQATARTSPARPVVDAVLRPLSRLETAAQAADRRLAA
jgi:hypothetical protein